MKGKLVCRDGHLVPAISAQEMHNNKEKKVFESEIPHDLIEDCQNQLKEVLTNQKVINNSMNIKVLLLFDIL